MADQGFVKGFVKRSLTYQGMWVFFFALLTLFSVLLSVLVFWGLKGIFPSYSPLMATGFGIGFWILVFVITLRKAWTTVSQKWECLVELFEEHIDTRGAGLMLPFPLGGFVSLRFVYVGEQHMPLYMNEQGQGGHGNVEFRDISAPVDATLYFKIVRSDKAVYNISGVYKALGEKMDSAVRSFLGQYTVDEVNIIKARTSLIHILTGEYVDPYHRGDDYKKAEEAEQGEGGYTKAELDEFERIIYENDLNKDEADLVRASRLYREVLDNWGIKIKGLAISDVVLSEELQEIRRRILEASKEKEAAEYKKETDIIRAQGKKRALTLEGVGISDQIRYLERRGLNPEQAASYLAKRLKWENVGQKGATVIETLSEEGGSLGTGARFGAGYKAVNSKKGDPKEEDLKEEEDKK